MKLFDFIQNMRDCAAQAGYDPRAHRTEICDVIATALIAQGCEVVGMQYAHSGPLGGESSRLIVQADTPLGKQRFYVNVYANNVYAADNERIREMLNR